jgi:hypothetical protein
MEIWPNVDLDDVRALDATVARLKMARRLAARAARDKAVRLQHAHKEPRRRI